MFMSLRFRLRKLFPFIFTSYAKSNANEKKKEFNNLENFFFATKYLKKKTLCMKEGIESGNTSNA